MAEQSTEASPDGTRRRWMRFSVRRLFLLLTMICIVAGVATTIANRIAIERERVDRTNELLWRVDKQLWEAPPPHFSRADGGNLPDLQSHNGPHRRLYRVDAVHLRIEPGGAQMTPAELASYLLKFYAEQIGHDIGGALYSTTSHPLPSGHQLSTAILSTQDADLLLIDALVDLPNREAVVRAMVIVASD
jgi:hypothetical protein